MATRLAIQLKYRQNFADCYKINIIYVGYIDCFCIICKKSYFHLIIGNKQYKINSAIK